MLDTGNEVSVTDFEFTGGILFPDIISLNFTLSVDPAGERPVGAGASNTGIVVHPVCIQSQFHSWPADGSTYVGCGSMVAEPFISLSAGTCIFFCQSSITQGCFVSPGQGHYSSNSGGLKKCVNIIINGLTFSLQNVLMKFQ